MTNKWIENAKITYSMTLVVFSIVAITAFNAEGSTQVAQDSKPVISLIVTWVSIICLSVLEGAQCSILKLKPIQPERFEESHPITSKICSIGYKGDNLDRYLVGRQFLVIILIFTINICGAPLPDTNVFDLPAWIQHSFIESGIAITSIVVILGQLPAQVNSWHCMLDYTNNCFNTVTLYVALIIEASGIMHAVYLIQFFICWLSGKPLETNEGPRSPLQTLFFWGRCILSVAILAVSMAVTILAIMDGQTTTWDRVPNIMAVILLFVLLLIGGMLEGIKMAYFAVSKLSKAELELHPRAMKTCDLLFRGDKQEHRLPGFWVGRQMFVTLGFVAIARLTKVNVDMGVEENIFGVSDGLQTFFNLGYLGAFITAILGSLVGQLIASVYPLEFLSNPVCHVLVQLCKRLEASGICSAYQVFGTIYRKVAGFELDEVYIGSMNDLSFMEKSESNTGDSITEPQVQTATSLLNTQVAPATPQTPDYMASEDFTGQKSLAQHEADITANINEMLELIQYCTSKKEKVVLERALALEKAALEDIKTEQLIIEAETLNDLESGESQA